MIEITPNAIFSIQNQLEFEDLALLVFQHQAKENEVYRNFIEYLSIDPLQIDSLFDIPFLPIEFFKSHKIVSSYDPVAEVFSSSGTTGMLQSKHYVTDLSWYEESFLHAFELFYGNPSQYIILALLPSYLERDGSSLIYMCEHLIRKTEDEQSGFYLNEFEKIKNIIEENAGEKKVLLIGVTYALLDFAEQFPFAMKNCIVMETGGMKGKRKEMLREEVHQLLTKAFQIKEIHSEYGMTELLSQAYSNGNGIFRSPPWMKVMIRETNDPFSYTKLNRTGGINIIDLANVNSCSFIATQDLGKLLPDGRFEVLGRFENADVRGCNLLVQ